MSFVGRASPIAFPQISAVAWEEVRIKDRIGHGEGKEGGKGLKEGRKEGRKGKVKLRTHKSFQKSAPMSRSSLSQHLGVVTAISILFQVATCHYQY